MTTGLAWTFAPARDSQLSSALTDVLGPLALLAADPRVTDVFLLADGRVFADRGEGAVVVSDLRISAERGVELARGLIESGGRHLDEASPLVDVRLAPGIRVHAALPPVALGGAVLSIRFSRSAHRGLDELDIAWAEGQRHHLIRAVDRRDTVLFTGATGSGKTTLLAASMALASPRDRIVVIEDVSELRIDHPHVVQLECRQPNLEGAGFVGLDRLVRESLRMRPSRLVVGECRGAELRDLLSALTTGHKGGAATLHALSLAEVPVRLDSLSALSGLTMGQLSRQVRSAFDLIVHVDYTPGQPRQLTLGRFVAPQGGDLAVEEI